MRLCRLVILLVERVGFCLFLSRLALLVLEFLVIVRVRVLVCRCVVDGLHLLGRHRYRIVGLFIKSFLLFTRVGEVVFL